MELDRYIDEIKSGQFRETYVGHARYSCHVLYRPEVYDVLEVWDITKAYAKWSIGLR